jgi:hypothetical protein
MTIALLPFHFLPSHAARRVLGADHEKVAILALRAILKHRRGLEVAHQQIRYGDHDFAFSSRIGSTGNLIVELDIGDARLSDRLVLEEDLRRAARRPRGLGPNV